MNKKYLYKDFKKKKNIYNLNQGYWKRKFQVLLKEKLSENNILFKNINKKGIKIYDANPIFTFLNHDKTKAIRIIQDDIDDDLNQININQHLISAWTDKIYVYDNNSFKIDNHNTKFINELVIALFLTRETVEITMELIIKRLKEDLTKDDIKYIISYR